MRKKQLQKALFMIPKDTEILIKVDNVMFGIENYSYVVDETNKTYLVLQVKQSSDIKK
jgi:hypothetical protein